MQDVILGTGLLDKWIGKIKMTQGKGAKFVKQKILANRKVLDVTELYFRKLKIKQGEEAAYGANEVYVIN